MPISPSLHRFLKARGIEFDVVRHRRTASSMRTAAAAHVPGDCLAKSVLLEHEDGYVLAIVPSTHRLDVGRLGKALGRRLGLATEEEVRDVFEDCDVGAIPAVGAAFGVETVLDDSLENQPEIYIEGGDHEQLVRVSGEQFAELMSGSRRGCFSHHV